MVKLKKKNEVVFIVIILLCLIFLFHNLNLFKKTYFTISRDYETRMTDIHGFCSLESFGFINFIQKKYNFKQKPMVINFEDVPNKSWAFLKFYKNQKIDKNYIVILNYQGDILKKENFQKKHNFNIEDYNLLEKSKNCYLFKIK